METRLIEADFNPELPELPGWHMLPKLIISIGGETQINIDGEIFSLSDGNFILINAFSLHYILYSTGHIAVLTLNFPVFAKNTGIHSDMAFLCRPDISADRNEYNYLRDAVLHYLASLFSDEKDTGLEITISENMIFLFLITGFRTDRITRSLACASAKHIVNAISYIQEHFQEPLSVSDVADTCHVTSAYLTHLFQKQMKISPLSFISEMRTTYSLHLLPTDKTLTQIAEESGFPGLRSYNAAFLKHFGITPALYRKQPIEIHGKSDDLIDIIHNKISSYQSYIIFDQKNFYAAVDVSKPLKEKAPHLKILNFGPAAALSDNKVIEELSSWQSSFQFTDIFLESVFDSPLVSGIVRKNCIRWDFSSLKKIFDSVLTLNLKPFLNIGSIPEILSPSENVTRFGASNCSIPDDYENWFYLLEAFFTYLTDCYGSKELRSWHISIWTSQEKMFLLPDSQKLKELFKFIRESAKVIHKVCPDIRIGSPHMELSERKGSVFFLKEYLTDCKQEGYFPDFLVFYVTSYSDCKENECQHQVALLRDSSCEYFSRLFEHTDCLIRSICPERPEICITLINTALGGSDLFQDTAFGAAVHTAALAASASFSDLFGGLKRKDYLPGWKAEKQEFCGGSGMLTANGIPKAIWYSEQLFQKLRGSLIHLDEHMIATYDGQTLQCLLFHSQGYKYLIVKEDPFDNALDMFRNLKILNSKTLTPLWTDPLKRYDNLSDTGLSVIIQIFGLPEAEYEKKEYTVNRQHGSSFDLWVESGGIEPDEETRKYLINSSIPYFRRNIIQAREITVLEKNMTADEVCLLELSPLPRPVSVR